MKIREIYIMFLMVACLACEGEPEKSENKTYTINEHTWQSKSSIQLLGEYNYQATEVPLQYYLHKNKTDGNKGKIDSIVNAHQKERIIEMEFSHISGQDLLQPKFNTQGTYTGALEYLAFAIRNDFQVVTSSKDTVQCLGVHFERNFNVAPYKKVLLYFNGILPNEDIQLIYQDRLFGKGTIKFNLKEKPIQL